MRVAQCYSWSMADDSLYRVTYKSGQVKTCNRRSLAGKIGLHNSEVRSARRWGYSRRPDHHIVKIERAPVVGWTDVTGEFESLEQSQD